VNAGHGNSAEALQPVRYEAGRPLLLAGLRRQHPFAQLGAGIPEQWQQLRAVGPIDGQTGTKGYGVMCGTTADAFEYMCAFEVQDFAGLPQQLGRMRIQAQHYAVFVHRDNVSSIRLTWKAIYRWLAGVPEWESAHKPDFEVYDESFNPQTGAGGIELWIAVRERRRDRASR
jgi:predicted transcriptional regulator YdeE